MTHPIVERPLLTSPAMARRVGALFGMAILIALVLVLLWNVYRHHEQMHETEETAVVRLDGSTLTSVVILTTTFC